MRKPLWRLFAPREKIVMTDAPAIGSAATPGVTAEWRTDIGRLSDYVSAQARTADIMVGGRSPTRAGVGAEVLEAGLMDSGRPLLIAAVKAPAAFDGTLAIAWKDTPEAACAVAHAAPFIRAAANVLIFSVNEPARKADKSSDRLRGMLSWHNPERLCGQSGYAQ